MPRIIQWIRRINAGYVAAFILIILCYVLTIIISSRLKTQTASITDTNATIVSLEQVLTNLKGAQSAWGEYIITNNRNNFEEYYATHRSIDSLLRGIYRFSAMTPLQRKSLDTLFNLINYMLPNKKANKDFYSRNNIQLIDSLKAVNAKYAILMDSITGLVKGMQDMEKNKIQNKKATLMSLTSSIKIISYITLLVAVFLFIYIIITFSRERRAKRKAYKKADEYHAQLESRIDELTQMNKEIKQFKSMEKFTSLGRVAAIIAHEIKNPLTNINLATKQLTDELPDDDSDSEIFIDIIDRNSYKINNLITDFLNATSFSELRSRDIPINEFIDEILQEAEDRISLEEIQVKKDYSTSLYEVPLDSNKLKIAFQNIIFNAIEAMEPGKGILHIRTEAKGNRCIIAITDNGIGMDEETLNHIFEPYYTTKTRKGTGLGLAQAQNIIFNHGGNIEVESKLNKGTRFIISLKFTDPSANQ